MDGEICIFKRYEIKYLVSAEERAFLEEQIRRHMRPDAHGESTVRSVYFDTPDARIVRRSLEKPVYKEKLRTRAYRTAGETDGVFVELKKKYRGVVYKRRIELPERTAEAYLLRREPLQSPCQISREIDAFFDFYPGLAPAMFLCYDRTAYFSGEDDALRVTFDRSIRWRREKLSLSAPPSGEPLLEEGQSLMEIKSGGAIPLWLTAALTEARVFRTSFSKYGAAYTTVMQNEMKQRSAAPCPNPCLQASWIRQPA
ncbi:MAG: polyphosphate polymerase domain-containing protein [Eubacteriales bacterium]